MATIKELKELALHAARGTAPANFSAETVDEALRSELASMCDSINNFQRNKYDIFDILYNARKREPRFSETLVSLKLNIFVKVKTIRFLQ